MDSSKKTKVSRKIDFKGVYKEEYLWRLILPLKLDSHLPKKKALYFILKALFVLKIFKFLS